MIKLSELTKIAEDKTAKEKRKFERASREDLIKYEKEYQYIITGLEKALINAAEDGRKSLIVFARSAFGSGIFRIVTNELYSMRIKSGNYYCAWRDGVIKEADVVRCAAGNFKRVYDYLKSQDLNPKIQHWMDGGGMDEGFEIVVKW